METQLNLFGAFEAPAGVLNAQPQPAQIEFRHTPGDGWQDWSDAPVEVELVILLHAADWCCLAGLDFAALYTAAYQDPDGENFALPVLERCHLEAQARCVTLDDLPAILDDLKSINYHRLYATIEAATKTPTEPEPVQPEWIDVNEQSPEVGQRVRFRFADGHEDCGHRTTESENWNFRHEPENNVVAWQTIEPQPAPSGAGDVEKIKTDAVKAARRAAYEAKRTARVERYEMRAAIASQRSNEAYNRSRRMAAVIPFGQPILVGHYSEKSDRNYRAKIGRAMDKSCEEAAKSDYWAGRAAAAASNHAIFSDNPDAGELLAAKIERLEKRQELMKAANAAIRKQDDDALRALGFTDEKIERLKKPDFCGRVGFPSYELTNNNANIRRLKERAAQLEKQAGDETSETNVGPVRIVENVEANRVQLFFPGKPADDVRDYLKRHGFKWSRFEGAWQRQRSNAATYHAAEAAKKVNVEAMTA